MKIEAVHQVQDRGYKIGELSDRLGVTSKSLRDWISKDDDTGSKHQMISGQKDELHRVVEGQTHQTKDIYITRAEVRSDVFN